MNNIIPRIRLCVSRIPQEECNIWPIEFFLACFAIVWIGSENSKIKINKTVENGKWRNEIWLKKLTKRKYHFDQLGRNIVQFESRRILCLIIKSNAVSVQLLFFVMKPKVEDEAVCEDLRGVFAKTFEVRL